MRAQRPGCSWLIPGTDLGITRARPKSRSSTATPIFEIVNTLIDVYDDNDDDDNGDDDDDDDDNDDDEIRPCWQPAPCLRWTGAAQSLLTL